VIPFAAERIREREPDRGIHLAWAAAGTWIAVNLPFALVSFERWSEFFRLNTTRGADWDSLWFSACHRLFGSGFLSGQTFCEHTGVVNLLSPILFLGLVALVWWRKERRWPGFERWTLGFPVIVLFLLTNKVYSPQYSLWILPWFALALPSVRLWLAFALTDVAVFVTRFAWFGRNAADRDPSFPAGWTDGFAVGFFELAVLVRAAVLVACLVAWVRREPERATGEALEPEVVAEAR
jgi:uncharacterized membrane protein